MNTSQEFDQGLTQPNIGEDPAVTRHGENGRLGRQGKLRSQVKGTAVHLPREIHVQNTFLQVHGHIQVRKVKPHVSDMAGIEFGKKFKVFLEFRPLFVQRILQNKGFGFSPGHRQVKAEAVMQNRGNPL